MDSVREARTGKPKVSSAIPYLPFELISEILARLPVKSLLQFKAVCKSWLSFISSTEFVRKHHLILCAQNYYSSSMTSKRLIINRKLQVILYYPPKSRPREIPIDVLVENKFDHRWEDQHEDGLDFDIIGSCDGLVCVEVLDSSYNDRVFLWNPCTRECVEAKQRNGEDQEFFFLHGFGHDYNSDDYKVLRVLYSSKTATLISMIYTLKKNSWRKIQDHPLGSIPIQKCATYVKGALHWLAKRRETSPVIISLDLTSETYMEVPKPNYGKYTWVQWESLGALEGCLCLLVLSVCGGIQNDIWVMKEYGVKESWTKFLTIPHMLGSVYYRSLTQMIWFWGNDEVVLDLHEEMVLYNTKTKSTTGFGIPVCRYDESHLYVESLVSPKAYIELGNK